MELVSFKKMAGLSFMTNVAKPLLTLVLIVVSFVGCDNKRSAEGVKEKARAEFEIGQELERQRQRQKAEAMEADLVRRKRLYENMNAEFEGQIKLRLFRDDDTLYPIKVQLMFNPQIPPESTGRVRELSEIEADLKALKYLVHGVLEIRASRYPYIEGCNFETQQVYRTGQLYLKTEGCNFFVNLYPTAGKPVAKEADLIAESSALVEKAMAGEAVEFNYLRGRGYFSQTGESFAILLKRKKYDGGGR